MVRLILHVGLHKCGSTFIQNTLFENAEALRAAKILYPRTGLSLDQPQIGRRHTRISLAARKLGPDAPLFHALHREITASGAETVVISHEGMSEPEFDPAIFGAIFDRYDTRVVLYARSPAGYIESRYRSSIRSNSSPLEIDAYIRRLWARMDVRQPLNAWRRAFGHDNVVFHNFDALPKGYPLANHLLQSGGIEIAPLAATRLANLRDDNSGVLLRLLANQQRASGSRRYPAKWIEGAAFDYGSNNGRLISDEMLETLQPLVEAYGALMADEGKVATPEALLDKPFDSRFFDAETRRKARDVLVSVARRTRWSDGIYVAGHPLNTATVRKAARMVFAPPIDAVRHAGLVTLRRMRGVTSQVAPPPVIIMMRYSVLQERLGKSHWNLSRQASPEEYRARLFDDDRLALRLRMLEQIVLPSLVAQSLPLSAARSRLLVFTSTELPQHHLDRLRQVLAPYPWAKLSLVTAEIPPDYPAATLAALQEMGVRSGPYATVRLDDDDAVARTYMENLALHISPSNVGKVVTFPCGYIGVLDAKTTTFSTFYTERWAFNAQGLAAIGRIADGVLQPEGLETVYQFKGHDRVGTRYKYVMDHSFRAFIRSVYPQQDTAGLDRGLDRMRPVAHDKVRRDFDLGDIPPAT